MNIKVKIENTVQTTIMLALVFLALCSNIAHASDKKTVKIFDVDISQTTRNEFREVLKQQGIQVIKEDDEGWTDTYNPSSVMEGVNRLEVSYHRASGRLAIVNYQFTGSARGLVFELGEQMVKRYGRPTVAEGNERLGRVLLGWSLNNNMELLVTRSWPGSKASIAYRNKTMVRAMQSEKDAFTAAESKKQVESLGF